MTSLPQNNIDDKQRRYRLYSGIGGAIAGILLFLFLLWNQFHPAWRLILFVPFWLGALGVFQYRDGI